MDRREFLKSLLALGAVSGLPCGVNAEAIDQDIQAAWAEAKANPFTFYVSEFGALSTDAIESYPESRLALFGYNRIGTKDELLALAHEVDGVERILDTAFEDEMSEYDGKKDPWNGRMDKWVAVWDDTTVEPLIKSVNNWLEREPDEQDYERATLRGIDGTGGSLSYFRDTFEFCNEFDIVVVEGDCPGSSYYAAELRMDMDEANELAKDMDLPIRFALQG